MYIYNIIYIYMFYFIVYGYLKVTFETHICLFQVSS